MPKSCEVKVCSWRACNTGRRRHAFPFKRPDIQQKWIIAIGQDPSWQPSKGSFICSEHFTDSDYRTKPGSKTMMLKYNAVPTKNINVNKTSNLDSFMVQQDSHIMLAEKELLPNVEIKHEQNHQEPDENNVNGGNYVHYQIDEPNEDGNTEVQFKPTSLMFDNIKKSSCVVIRTAKVKKPILNAYLKKKPGLQSNSNKCTQVSRKSQCNLLGRYLQKKMSYLRRKNKLQILEIKSLKKQLEKFKQPIQM